MYPALHQELVHPCVRSWFDMPLVSSTCGASTPFLREANAAKRSYPPSSRASWRGSSVMSDAEKTKLGGKEAKLDRLELALAFLRAKHPFKTADCVAAQTGISANTISKWLRGESRPGWGHTMALIGVYGADFLWASSPQSRVWLAPARKLEELRQLESERVRLNQRIKELGGNAHAGMGGGDSAAGGGPGLHAGDLAGETVSVARNERLADEGGDSGGGP
jgi:hypothetical protein